MRPSFGKWQRTADWRNFRLSALLPDVCRDELLFEIDGEAVGEEMKGSRGRKEIGFK